LEDLKLADELYYSLERDELELYYQPQVDLETDEIVGLEALLRWNRLEIGMISPSRFIPIAEKTGLITKIGEWAVRTACRQNKLWQDMELPKIPVSVNISARQIEDENFVELIGGILKETGLPAIYLDTEITENSVIWELNAIAETLRPLKRLGVGITVDDFGTVYSSLNYIKKLPIDTVKIDKCFVDGIGVGFKDEAILKTVIALVQNLRMKTVAEGVETKYQVDFLKKEGCRIIQGYYYYKPMPVTEIEKLLKTVKKFAEMSASGV
jgi:EAL domain-containing protein (putative c-di-GMP-specific phosphodiesterase class I)